MSGKAVTERLNGLVLVGQRGYVDWLNSERAPEWTGYQRTERLNELELVGQTV